MSLPIRYFCGTLLALLVAAASGGLARADDSLPCAQFTRDGPPQPTPRSDPRGIERLDSINQAVKNVPHSVLFLGNSLTEGWGPASWATSLAPRGVLNAGISGDLTDHVIWRLDHGNLDGPPPKAV